MLDVQPVTEAADRSDLETEWSDALPQPRDVYANLARVSVALPDLAEELRVGNGAVEGRDEGGRELFVDARQEDPPSPKRELAEAVERGDRWVFMQSRDESG